MYTHVVLFKLKDKKDTAFFVDVLRSMDCKIAELKGIEVGINDVEADRNYDIVLITRHDSKAQMLAYQDSQYHQVDVLPKIKSLIELTKAVDFQAD